MADQLAASPQQLAEDVCRDYRRWAPDLGRPPNPGKVLKGGFSHHVQIIESPRQRWVLRITRHGASIPTVTTQQSPDRAARHRYEVTIQTQAAACDIAPRVLFSDPRRGLTLMQYVDDSRDGPDSPAAIAQLLKRIHALPAQGMPTRSTDVLRDYLSYFLDGCFHQDLAHPFEPGTVVMPSKAALARLLGAGLSSINRAMQAIDTAGDVRPVLCHNDLLQANRLRCGDRLYALDWEYAGPGDPFFDIAVCASQLSPRQTKALLDLYLCRGPTPAEQLRFRAQRLVYACIEACWFTLHHPDTDPAARSYAVLCGILQTGD